MAPGWTRGSSSFAIWTTSWCAPIRWKLRRAVKIVNQTLAALGLEKHPEKTFVGRVEKGFDFLGYRQER
jgi:hypothetical protein